MRRYVLAAVVLAVVCSVGLFGPSVGAASLKISPLRYDATLAPGEKKKGFVDITNPTPEKVTVKLSVQAFRQTNDAGSLEFYDNEQITAGVVLDYIEVALGARETLHLAFILDGTKLASGDNFAAIFATSVPNESGPGEQAVRVGTLLIISNGTSSSHEAVIENLSGQLLQFGDGLDVSFRVRNMADQKLATGFSPSITVTAWPYINDTVTGPLVFAGRSRMVDYVKKGDYLGILAVRVQTGDSEQVIYRLAVTGHWRFILPFSVIVIGLLVWLVRILKTRSNNRGK